MLKRTPLYETHKKLGARLVEFGGWEMPVQYSGVIEEHNAVRTKAGLFDISHMGEIFVTGERAQEFINHITTNDIRRIKDGGCQYAACCYENGTVVDDVISYQYNQKKYLVVVNASNTDKDFEWFKTLRQAQGVRFESVTIENKSPQYCQLALQGPLSQQILQPLTPYDLSSLKYYTFCETQVAGKNVILSRTGYTGEDGFEIYGPAGDAQFLWDTIFNAGTPLGMLPIGLAARDTLRLEPAYSLYGHEISDEINPLEARLSWVVKLDKTEFIGKKALEEIKKNGIKRELIGIEMVDQAIPRQGYPISNGKEHCGVVTSGTFSPTLKKSIAFALVNKGSMGSDLFVEVRGQNKKAKVVQLPFYRRK